VSFPQALVAEWGLLTLIVVGALTAVALACGAVALLGGGGGIMLRQPFHACVCPLRVGRSFQLRKLSLRSRYQL
jgi:hypothetical protein